MAELTDPQVAAFLSAGDRNGKLSYLRADRRPAIVPVWFVVDNGEIVFFTGPQSPKAKAFGEDPRVAFLVDDGRPPYSYVSITGVVSKSVEPERFDELLAKIVARYVPEEEFEKTLQFFKGQDEALYRIRATKVQAKFDLMNSLQA
ncbi:MAG: PPOX class F420-dependent oxidoreductase [Segniliparus sp.]|uniref:PPOX class F420-dependent oxidoreductase n=1 Tax=Segniliparus sp. TaxID=2804064 RepID=UPI003F3734BD